MKVRTQHKQPSFIHELALAVIQGLGEGAVAALKRFEHAAANEITYESGDLVGPNEMAAELGVDPKVFRQALRDQNFPWHRHNERWLVRKGSPEHQDMLEVLGTLTG